MAIPNPCGWGNHFCIGYDGANFLCAKSGGGFPTLHGSRISPDGEVLDKPAVPLAAFDSTLVIGHAGLARDTLGNVGLVFFTFETDGYMSDRIRAAVFPRLTGGIESPRPVADLNRLRVSPNPSTGIAWVRLTGAASEPQTTTVRDIAGRVRTEVSLSPASADRGRTMLDLRRLPPGVYFCTLSSGRQKLTRKLVLTE
jgi:hypothetical protein